MHKNFLNSVRKYDEYYTKYEHVADIFERLIPKDYCKNKIIYCPCDSEESNFVKYLKDNKDKLEYKELVYTWDDYNTHYDLFEYADCIITNPPFSKLCKEFIPILNKCKKDFFILGSLIATYAYYENFDDKINVRFERPDIYFNFVCPDKSLPDNPQFIYIYNIKGVQCNYPEVKFKEESKFTLAENENGIMKNFDYIKNISKNEKDWVLVPSTILLEHNRKYFDVKKLEYKTKYLDGKGRYVRMMARWKQ